MNQSVTEMLGTTADLLYGYDASWLSEQRGNNALYIPPKEALTPQHQSEQTDKGSWGELSISLHDNPKSLMDGLLPYKVKNPADGLPAPDLPSGTLLLEDADSEGARQQLSKTLGVNLEPAGYGYVLVLIKRLDNELEHACRQQGLAVHPNPSRIPDEIGVKDEFHKGMAKLRRVKPRGVDFSPSVISADDASGYLQFFAEQGTHFISRIEQGDVIFQIYKMPQARFEAVKRAYDNQPEMLSGAMARLFVQYTTPYKEAGEEGTGSTLGYVREYGNILSFSQSDTLSKAIASGDWIDPDWAQTNNIFALYQQKSPVSRAVLDKDYQDVTSIYTELTALTLFAEHSRKQVWERVFKGAVIQKYQDHIKPNFVSYIPDELDTLMKKDASSGFLSTIATPTVNAYNPILDYSDMALVAPEQVQQFTLYSNYGYRTKSREIVIPGKDVLLCGQVFALETEEVTTLEVDSEAIDSLALYCQHFYGGLLIRNNDNSAHFTLVDGLKYASTSGEYGRSAVAIVDDIRKPPKAEQLPRLKSSLNFNYTFSYSGINALSPDSNPGDRDFLSQSALWITQIIPEDCDDADLLDLRVRALNLYYVEKNPELGSYVPILPADRYQQEIDNMLAYTKEINATINDYQERIALRKVQELQIDTATALNENIINSGKLLSGYIDASKANQQALSGYYGGIIQQQQGELVQQEAVRKDLQAQLDKQQAVVNEAVLNYRKAIEDQAIKDIIMNSLNLAFDVANNMFDLSKTIAKPAKAIDSAKHLGEKAQRVQKFRDIVNATTKLFSSAVSDISSIVDAQSAFAGASDVLSSNLSWDQISLYMESTIDKGPKGNIIDPKRDTLKTEFKNLVLIGKSLTEAEAAVQHSADSIYNRKRQQKLINAQTERLVDLNKNLQPASIDLLDTENIDLIGLTGSLKMMQSDMLGMLSSTFTIKDQALQYQYLQTATSIESFDVLGFNRALVMQSRRTEQAETLQRQFQESTTQPLTIEIKIPADRLRGGASYSCSLRGDLPELRPYVNMRIQSVVASIDGIEGTNEEGKYLINLAYDGRPFFDRDFNRNVVAFNTLRREHNYLYQVEGNQPLFSDHGEAWSDGVSPVTPFSNWLVSLPNTQTNKGIRFTDATVTLKLTFVMKARINDARARISNGMTSAVSMLGESPEKPTVKTLVSNMADKTVLNGWDVVFNMGVKQINKALKQQYEQLKLDDETYGGKISAVTVTPAADSLGLKKFDLQDLEMTYGYPQLSFLNDEAECQLDMIITSGTYLLGNRYVGNDNEEDRTTLEFIASKEKVPAEEIRKEEVTVEGETKTVLVLDSYTTEFPLDGNATLKAFVKLRAVHGKVEQSDNVMKVTLKMSDASFNFDAIDIQETDIQAIAFNFAVKAYFSKHPVEYVVNSLDMSDIATLPDLQPNEFRFATSSYYEMLQMFIETNKNTVSQKLDEKRYLHSDVGNPIPEGSDCSLMISSEIFFSQVLGASIIENPYQKELWTLKGKEEEGENAAWYAEFTSANVDTNVNLSSLNYTDTKTAMGNITSIKAYSYAPDGGNPVKWDLNDMTIEADVSHFQEGLQNTMKMSLLQENKIFKFIETIDRRFPAGKTKTKTYSSEVSLDLNASLPISITGEGREQLITIDMTDNDTSIIGRTSGGGPCGSDDLQAQVNTQLKQQIPPQIKDQMNVSFKGVSVFALQNLLFPDGDQIDMKQAIVPGDLLVLGIFNDKEEAS